MSYSDETMFLRKECKRSLSVSIFEPMNTWQTILDLLKSEQSNIFDTFFNLPNVINFFVYYELLEGSFIKKSEECLIVFFFFFTNFIIMFEVIHFKPVYTNKYSNYVLGYTF